MGSRWFAPKRSQVHREPLVRLGAAGRQSLFWRLSWSYGGLLVAAVLLTGVLLGLIILADLAAAHHRVARLSAEALERSNGQLIEVASSVFQDATNEMLRKQAQATRRRTQTLLAETGRALHGSSHRLSEIGTRSMRQMAHQLRTHDQQTVRRLRADLAHVQERLVGPLGQRLAREAKQPLTDLIRANHLCQAKELASRVERHLERAAQEVLDHLRATLILSQLLGRSPDTRQRAAGLLLALIQRLMAESPDIQAVTILDRDGNERFQTEATGLTWLEGTGRQDRSPWLAQALSGEREIIVAARQQGPTVAVAEVYAPLVISRSQPIGAVRVRLSLDQVRELIHSAHSARRGFVALLARDGQLVAANGPAAATYGTPVRDERLRAAAQAGRAGGDRWQPCGHPEYLRTYAPVGQTGWLIVVHQPVAEALALPQAMAGRVRSEARRLAHELGALTTATVRHNARTLVRQAEQQIAVASRTMRRQARQDASRAEALLLNHLRSTESEAVRSVNLATYQAAAHARASMARDALAAANQLVADLRRTLRRNQADALRHVGLIAFWVLLFALGAGIAVTLLVSRSVLRPVQSLAEATARLAAGDYSVRVLVQRPDELGTLAQAFNHMADTIAQNQAQLVQSGKLASIGTLAAGVAHELNQPLMVIRGYAQGLRAAGVQDPEVLRALEKIERQTSRMMKIINHLRCFSRQTTGHRERVRVSEVIDDAFILLNEQLRRRGVEVTLELESDLAPIRVDRGQIEQVLINLLTNARDALEGREAARITVSARQERDEVLIRVEDNGAGIPPEVMGHIFDPFFTTKEVGKGTGLGLSISYGIIKDHGGQLECESQPGVGTTFTIRLPAVPEEDEPPAPEPTLRAPA